MENLKTIFSGWYLLLFVLAITAHVLLGVFAPDPRGYAYDLYIKALYLVSTELRIPNRDDCWICYHPPLYPVAGAAILKIVAALGFCPRVGQYAVSGLGSVLSLTLSVYGFLLYLIYRKNQRLDLVLWALILFLPVKFINSFAIEADILGAALIVAATYHFALYLRDDETLHLLVCAVLIGLATLTKYTGVVVGLYFGLVLLWRLARARDRQGLNHGLLYAVIVSVMGGWLYVSNIVKYDTPFPGNLAWNTGEKYWSNYDFTSFGLKRIVRTFDPAAVPETPEFRDYWKHKKTIQLWRFYQYNNEVLTSLYGQLWTDFSFFSVKGRHGLFEFQEVFRGKATPKALLWAILIAGLVPVVLGGVGFALLALQREAGLLLGLFVITVAVYVNWFTGYTIWMLKTKYLLFLIPVWLVCINESGGRIGAPIANVLLWPAVVLSVLYCLVFAVG